MLSFIIFQTNENTNKCVEFLQTEVDMSGSGSLSADDPEEEIKGL